MDKLEQILQKSKQITNFSENLKRLFKSFNMFKEVNFCSDCAVEII
jgi:predicted translin family RNA/ssDNA-binding protein